MGENTLNSYIEDKEFNFKFEASIDENKKVFYGQHLGILGCICMMYEYKPDLVIFSEFGEELKAIRKDVVSKISNAMGMQCLPGDIGLHIKIDDLSVFCCKSASFVQKENIEIYEFKDDLLYISKTSFSTGELANKQRSVEESNKKLFTELIKSK